MDSSREKVLVVEDDEDILELIVYNLKKNRYEVVSTSSGEEAIALAQSEKPEIILLDIMLPDINGIEVCRRVKNHNSLAKLPIVFISAKGEEEDVCRGLEAGADDYIVKPFSVKILLARVQSVVRRASAKLPELSDVIRWNELEIKPSKHEVTIKGSVVELTASEFKILHVLLRKRGCVFTRSQLIDAVHGSNHIVTDRAIDFQLVGLRKKILEYGECIETVRGVGYRFRESNES